MKGKMKGWWQLHRWGWRCGGSEQGSSQRESITRMTMLRAVCVRVCAFDKQTDKQKALEHGNMGLTDRLTRRVVACLLCDMFNHYSL